jgi:hypothetical protein
MAWKKLITEDDFGGFANPTGVVGGAATNGAATTAMRSDAVPALGPLTRDLDFGAFKGVNAADPTGAQHLATKAYVDAVAQGLAPKDSVRLATASALPGHTRAGSTLTASANGALSVDGVVVNNGDRVLVKNEGASHLEHGIYVVTDKGSGGTPWVLDRAADADSEGDLLSASVFVQEGATNFDTQWVMTTDAPIVVNTTALAWTQFASAGDIVGGAGLTKTGNTLDVNVDGATLEINADTLRVKALGITDSHIAAANKDGAVGTPSLRTLGTGAQQATAGNDGRLSDTRVPAAAQAGTAWDFADNEVVGLRPKGYTTGTRPASPAVGRVIFDTTINRAMVWY